jgi:ketosteroid isomerase-like protein
VIHKIRLDAIVPSPPTDTVFAWLDAVNAGDIETALKLTTPDVEIIGPRGTGRGRDVLRTWLGHARTTFVTQAIYVGGDAVVVAQRGIWRDAASGAVRGEANVSTRFRVVAGQVAEIQRYDEVAAALGDAGLSSSDIRP